MTSLSLEAQGAVIFRSSLSVSGVYTDNLFFASVDKKPDFTSIVSPAFNLAFSSRDVIFSVGYKGLAQFQSQNPEADGYFQSLSINLDLPVLNRQIRGVKVTVTEDISFSPELPGFSFGADPAEAGKTNPTQTAGRTNQAGPGGQLSQGVQLARTDTFRNKAGITFEYPWTKRFASAASYTNIITRFSGSAFQDRDIHHVTGGGVYQYPYSGRTTWSGSANVAVASGDVADAKKAIIYNAELGATHKLSRLTTTAGKIGVAFPQGRSPNFIMSADISRLLKNGALSLRYVNRIATGLGIITSVTRRERIIGNVTQQLGKRSSLYIRAAYASTASLSGNEVSLSSVTAGSGVFVRLLEWLNGSINYSYFKQSSSGMLGRNGERHSVGFTLSAIAPPWRILQ